MKLPSLRERFRPRKRVPRLKTILIILAVLVAGLVLIALITVGQFSRLLIYYPALTGFPGGQRTYLLLFQNNAELRPTGGFISSYGIIKFKNGLLSDFQVRDSYDEINKITGPAPYPLDILLAGPTYPGHGFRDANFDPDFRLSAQQLGKFFVQAFPETELDGVIAIDLQLIEKLLAIVGPVTVDGLKFDEHTLFHNMEKSVSDIDLHNLDAIDSRKNTLKKFAKKLMLTIPLNVQAAPRWRTFLLEQLEQKHILLNFKNKNLQQAVEKIGWDGALVPDAQKEPGDFLAVVETNLGGMKSDRYIQREIRYEVDVTDGVFEDGSRKANAQMEIKMNHTGAQNIPLSGWYQGWIRTYIPGDSQIIERKVLDENGREIVISDSKKVENEYVENRSGQGVETDKAAIKGKINKGAENGTTALTGLGTRIVFFPGNERILHYTYELPAGIITDRDYVLHLRKQPGTDADYYNIVIKAPQGRQLKSDDFQIREDRAYFQGFLRADKTLRLKILADEDPPRIIGQETIALNKIRIYFNEPIAPNPNYTFGITDLNRAAPQHTDSITIEQVTFPDERTIELQTTGMTDQGEEHFRIKMQGITDRYGTKIAPNPREITVVYR